MESVKTFKNDYLGIIKIYNTSCKLFNNDLKCYKRYSFDINKGVANSYKHNGTFTEEQKEVKMKKYVKKIRQNIIDLALNNVDKWEYFITLTFNIEDYSHDKVIELLSKWLKLQRKKNKNMYYLLVPEFHKSGRIHFHGLVGNVPFWVFTPAVNPHNNKKIFINGTQIYNLKNYNLGFTTISKIKDNLKVSNYISKYATKDIIILKNKRKYWYSRNLDKVQVNYFYTNNDLITEIKNESIIYTKDFLHNDSRIELVNSYKNFLDNS